MRRLTARPTNQAKVVVLGGTIAGMAAAGAFKKTFDVTVVDTDPYLQWSPNTYQLLSGYKKAEHLRLHKRKLLKQRNQRLVSGAVVGLDLDRKKVLLAQGAPLSFDYLVVAIDSESWQLAVPGAEDYASDVRSIYQCNHIAHRLARAETNDDDCTLAIIGSGVEAVGALGEVLRRYRDFAGLDIQLIHSADRLFPHGPSLLHHRIMDALDGQPVQFHLGVKVNRVYPDYIELDTGRLVHKKAAIWAGRRLPASMLYRVGLVPNSGEFMVVDHTLRCLQNEAVYAIGESCDLGSTEPSPNQWIAMGEYVASVIERRHAGHSVEPWYDPTPLQFVSLGDMFNCVQYKDYLLDGPMVGHLQEAWYQMNMAKIQPVKGLSGVLAATSRFQDGLLKQWLDLVLNPKQLMQLPDVKKIGRKLIER